MKILIVDDEEDVRNIARLSLERIGGMDCIDASSGAAAIELAAREAPDAILLDMMMPGMDGVATLQQLREAPSTMEIPVVFLTAKAMPFEVERLRSMGALGVIVKPFDPRTLADQVRAMLDAR